MKTQPDILLIVLDTLRADRLSCYGYARETSPHIDAFARDATLYEHAISPAQWTIPAHASLFSGEYPSTHQTTQIYDKHGPDRLALADLLQQGGYLTVGFCNNPLLGVVDNGLDRGFAEFYNYGGTLPNRPDVDEARPRRVQRAAQRVLRALNRIVTPLQDAFARNKLLLRIALHPRVVPLWRRYVNFKGNTAQSIRDVVGYLQMRRRKGARRPLFAFMNLMETHLPYGPRSRFIRKFVPYYRHDRQARDFMQKYNHEHYRWMIPLTQPLTGWQGQVINDMYDAEVAYQDHMLRRLFGHLNEPEVRENTIVIITSDHGEGLNHHNFVGHSLVAYDDLVRVPLIVRYPERYPRDKRVPTFVSTRRIFHSILEAAGIYPTHNSGTGSDGAPIDVEQLSLAQTLGDDPENGIVYTEAYTPDTLIALMENQDSTAIETFRCREMRRAVYQDGHKLIDVGGKPDELFDVIADPDELENLIADQPQVTSGLQELLVQFQEQAHAARLRLEEDKEIARRLRGLGYIE
jgi:arylsulfatase A-like enzyme